MCFFQSLHFVVYICLNLNGFLFKLYQCNQGSVAYVSQEAWIQNATLQNNVIFDKPFTKHVYDEVIAACALTEDLKVLPAGDQTEIGEKVCYLSWL